MSRLIPDSYMYRAIGADINGACGKCKLSRSDCMCHSLSRMDICGIIDDAPSVDAVPVVRGEWVAGKEIAREMLCDETIHIFYEDYKCSVCGLIIDKLLFNTDGTPFYKFCPNCGASMDAKEFEEPTINPCRGCDDYDGFGGCKSCGGCAKEQDDG